MKSIVFISPFQDEIELADQPHAFRRGEPQDVTDELADELLKSPQLFALAQQAQPAAQPSQASAFTRDDHEE